MSTFYEIRGTSAIIAVALTILQQEDDKGKSILPHLDIPDPIKYGRTDNIINCLEAIKLSGYEENKKRKVFFLGHSGK